MVSLPGLDLRWLVEWENGEDGAVAVALQEFWSGSLPLAKEPSVAPAFTRKGKDHIDAFLAEIEAALADTSTIAEKKKDFAQWYRKLYLASWQDFAGFFPKGAERLKGRAEWQPMAGKMASDQCPYFALLDRMAGEIFPWASDENLPSWGKLVFEWKSMKMLETKEALPAAGVLDKAVDKAGQEIKRMTGKAGAVAGKAVGEALEGQARTAKNYGEYRNALAEITPVSTSRKLAYEVAAKIYTEDVATGKSPFFSADIAVSRLRASMMGSSGSSDEVFWKLVTGPRDFLLVYVRNETACQLQSDWEAKVLVEMKGLSGWDNIGAVLLAQGGYVWKYVENGPVTPFIDRALKGYSAKEALGGTISFDASFFAFLDRGDVERKKIAERQRAVAAAAAAPAGGGGPPPKDTYPVGIKGIPTGTNPDAQKKPQSTRLELHCTEGVQSLVNYNYPLEKTFNWAPESCSDVTLQIEVPGIVLSKRYSGPTAFQAFLRDFRKGERTYYPREFRGQEMALEQLGIKYITVKYDFTGAGAALQHGAGGKGKPTPTGPPPLQPIPIPTRIATCWD